VFLQKGRANIIQGLGGDPWFKMFRHVQQRLAAELTNPQQAIQLFLITNDHRRHLNAQNGECG
jgi:hypothetical protein